VKDDPEDAIRGIREDSREKSFPAQSPTQANPGNQLNDLRERKGRSQGGQRSQDRRGKASRWNGKQSEENPLTTKIDIQDQFLSLEELSWIASRGVERGAWKAP